MARKFPTGGLPGQRLADWVAWRLRFMADHLSPETSARKTGFSFEFVRNVGLEVNAENHGCPIWYMGRADFERAFERRTDGQAIVQGQVPTDG